MDESSSKQQTLGERNYSQFAARYAEISATKPHNAYYDRPALLSLLPDDMRGLRVLDAGCGSGHYTLALLERGADVVAFDVTPEFVQIASDAVGDHARAFVLHHDIQQPFYFADDASFDYVLCALVLDYIEDWLPVYREFARVLKTGGKTVVSHGHPMGDYLWVQRLFADDAPNYFQTHQFTATWSGFGDPAPEITSYRRPLQAMMTPILDAGLMIEKVLEPTPTDAFKQADPVHYEKLFHMPGFICFRSEKPAR